MLFWSTCAWGDWQGYMEAEGRYFPESPLSPDQFSGTNASIALAPRYLGSANSFDFAFEPFLRLDQHDSNRSHVDLRALNLGFNGERWSALVGVDTVFWGVTEFAHVVDIINQVDQLEGVDDESVLGQPMLLFETFGAWGSLQAFVLPGFRERKFPGRAGRLRGPKVNTAAASYTSSQKDKHVDLAFRWMATRGPLDAALSYFKGTSRDPLFLPYEAEADADAGYELQPHYDQVRQLGVELQITAEEWLGKLEYIEVNADLQPNYRAVSAGVEYPLVGIFGSPIDIGLVLEYMWDSRGQSAPTPFENDWALGTRLAFNNAQDTSVLVGVIYSPQDHGKFFSVEASTRINSRWRAALEARFAQNVPADNIGSVLNRDGFIEIELRRYF